jgi:hypothetical protein
MNAGMLVLALLVFAAVVVLGLLARRGHGARDDGPWPFEARRLLSAPEQTLFHRLRAALPERIVLTQVQVSRVLRVKAGAGATAWRNRIDRLSYDFVVCAPDFSVLAAIELDDASHARPERVDADRRKDRASAAAGIRLIRWPVSPLPDEAAIRHALGDPAAPSGQTQNFVAETASAARPNAPPSPRGRRPNP